MKNIFHNYCISPRFSPSFTPPLHVKRESSDAVISPVGAAQDACSGSMAAKKSLTGLGNGKEQSSASRVAQARAEAARSSRSKVRQQRGASTGPQQLSSTTAAGGGLQGDPAESSVVKPAVESRRWSDMTSDEDSEPIAPKLRKFDPPKRSFSSVVTGGLMKKTSCEVNKVNRPGSPPAQQGSAVATVVGAKGKTTRITCKSARGVKSAVTGDTTSTPVTPEATAVTEQTKTQAPAETNVKNKGITKKGGENNPSTPTVIQQQQQEEIETTVGTTGSPKGSAVPLNSARGSARVSSGNKKSTMSKAATTAGCRRQSKSGSRAEEKRTEMATVPEENELSGYGAESMETAHWGTMPPAGQCHPLPGFYPPNGMPPMMMFPGPGYPSVPMLTPMLPQGYGPLMGNLPPYDHPHFGPEGEMNSSRGTPQKKRSKEANRKQQQQWNGVSPMQGGLPQAHMYGHIRRHPTATIVYTTSPIPQDTTSIILVPMANGNQSGGHHPAVPIIGSYPIPQFDNNNGPPPSPPVTHPPSGPQSLRSVRTHSVASEASFDGTRPVTVCIDRNVFKSWFDTDVPEFQQLRVKRYRTIDSFVHWMMKYCKRK
ncbi:hypothetical protein Pmar_PMAR017475 [Perkinsus marinus ATCC 50983]|uniref:Uncharacterized protein n=1 Tax=Perkinsus marinus (strain ATCC 50983 / TXsc) TaxID=423536 RepID=C5KG23_PERM5|nr:hypothetical protein Pmar_PMAR017475 [Perkinsus marinus ATCC 50983]EER16587.1 hypothetical protein Pmar_PMAR017475 [Perkinsus marinus ATCC 50983]|eukprot:XP_002784791.1 hypothetical protein Pmar_PMAR017475 [Perkinsus marinus ATCC 50983]